VKTSRWLFPCCLAALGLCLALPGVARCQEQPTEAPSAPGFMWSHGSSLALFAGRLTSDMVGAELLPPDKFKDRFMVGLAWDRELGRYGDWFSLELEPLLIQHFGRQEFLELGASLILRWRRFPWNHLLPTTFALGEGLSYTTSINQAEEHGDAQPINNLLNLIVAELAFRLPHTSASWVFLRLHHRSPVFKLLGDNAESNYMLLGVRWEL